MSDTKPLRAFERQERYRRQRGRYYQGELRWSLWFQMTPRQARRMEHKRHRAMGRGRQW
jgi:hypothetical protein